MADGTPLEVEVCKGGYEVRFPKVRKSGRFVRLAEEALATLNSIKYEAHRELFSEALRAMGRREHVMIAGSGSGAIVVESAGTLVSQIGRWDVTDAAKPMLSLLIGLLHPAPFSPEVQNVVCLV